MPFSETHSKLTGQEIRRELLNISSLGQEQKKQVGDFLAEYKGEGLLEDYEFKHALRDLKHRRVELGLSEIDVKNIEDHFLG